MLEEWWRESSIIMGFLIICYFKLHRKKLWPLVIAIYVTKLNDKPNEVKDFVFLAKDKELLKSGVT